jgi:glycosyltransferase involved in cell wall biosynthesis
VRILLDYRPALRERTGVGEYVHGVARAVAASTAPGESLTLFSASWRDRLRPDVVPGWATLDRRIPVRTLNYAWHRWEWPPVERIAGRAFEVVHAAHPLLIPARRAARVITIHDLDFLDHPERTRAEVRRDYPELAAAHARRADRIVVVSRATADAVEARLGVPRSQVSVCSPGAPDWPRRTVEPTAGVILFFGTLEPRKNVPALLDAYERLLAVMPHAPRLVLAGRAVEGAERILERARTPPLAGHVDLSGYVDPSRRLETYDTALVLVMPSHLEGFGLPALEAMTRGIPVVAANRGALPEVVGDAGHLIDPKDPEAIAQALRLIVESADRRQQMRERGWAQAAKYRWRDTADHIREAWTLAVERRARRG